MTANNDTKTTSAPMQKTPNASKTQATHTTKKSHKSNKSFFQLMTILLAFIAVILAIYALDLSLRQRQGTQFQAQNLLHQMQTMKEQQREAKSNFESTIQSMIDSDYKLHNQLNNLNKNLQSTIQQRTYQTKDWLFLKARYYLELAQINANWSDNFQASLALLQEADALLTDTQDQRILAVRQTIAKEIAQIQAIPKVDITGALSQLDAIQDTIVKLPLKSNFIAAEKLPAANAAQDNSGIGWKQQLKQSLNLLQKLIVIRRHEEDVLPLPSPEYEFMLREAIQLNIQEAQWALLKNNEVIYKLSLANTLKNVNRTLATDAATTKNVIEQLQKLQQFQLIQQKPKLEESLHLLNEFIDSKDTLMPTKTEAVEHAK